MCSEWLLSSTQRHIQRVVIEAEGDSERQGIADCLFSTTGTEWHGVIIIKGHMCCVAPSWNCLRAQLCSSAVVQLAQVGLFNMTLHVVVTWCFCIGLRTIRNYVFAHDELCFCRLCFFSASPSSHALCIVSCWETKSRLLCSQISGCNPSYCSPTMNRHESFVNLVLAITFAIDVWL